MYDALYYIRQHKSIFIKVMKKKRHTGVYFLVNFSAKMTAITPLGPFSSAKMTAIIPLGPFF